MARARCRALFTDGHAGVQQLGHLGWPASAAPRAGSGTARCRGGQVLEGGDEGEPDRFPARPPARPGRPPAGATRASGIGRHPARLGQHVRRSTVGRPSTTGPGPSAGPAAAALAACRGTRWWRCGTATTAARSGPRSRRRRARPAPSSPAPRPRPRSPSRASGSSSRSAPAGTPQAPARPAGRGPACHRGRSSLSQCTQNRRQSAASAAPPCRHPADTPAQEQQPDEACPPPHAVVRSSRLARAGEPPYAGAGPPVRVVRGRQAYPDGRAHPRKHAHPAKVTERACGGYRWEVSPPSPRCQSGRTPPLRHLPAG